MAQQLWIIYGELLYLQNEKDEPVFGEVNKPIEDDKMDVKPEVYNNIVFESSQL